MKQILTAVFLIFPLLFSTNCSCVQAGHEVKTKQIGDIQFIIPTIDLLIHYAEQTTAEWESEMEVHNYIRMGSDNAKSPIYSKGTIGDVILAISNDAKHKLVSFDFFNHVSKESLMTDFFKFIEPYYAYTESNIRYHKYKNWIIGIKKSDTEYMYSEHIWFKPY